MLRRFIWQLAVLGGLLLLILLGLALTLGSTQLARRSQMVRHVETRLPSPTTMVAPLSAWTTPTAISRFAAMNPDLVQAQYEGRLLPNGTILPVVYVPAVGMYVPQEGVRRLSVPTATVTPTPSHTATFTATPSETSTFTDTPSYTPSATLTPLDTATPTYTPIPPTVTLVLLTATATPSISPTPITPTASYTASNTFTPTSTHTFTPTFTPTPTFTLTPTPTYTFTPDRTKLVQRLGPTIVAYDEPSTFSGCAPRGFPVAGVLTKLFSPDHRGIDLGVYVGTPVDATHSGVVVYADWSNLGYGYLVVVQSGIYTTYYAHLSDISVEVGDSVTFGQIVALSGNTGNSSGPHLHYEVRVNDIEIDPFTFETLQVIRC